MPDDRPDSDALRATRTANLLRIHPDLERSDSVAHERFNLLNRAFDGIAERQAQSERPREAWWRSAFMLVVPPVIVGLAIAWLSGVLHLGISPVGH